MSAPRRARPTRLLDLTVGFFVVVMLGFFVVDLAIGRPSSAGGAFITIALLVATWAIARAAIGGR